MKHVPVAQATRAVSSTRKRMIDANWTIGYTEQLAVFIYQRSYRIASYKNVNHVYFEKHYLIYHAFLFQSSSVVFNSECFLCTDILN